MHYALLIYEDEAAQQKAEHGPPLMALIERHVAFSGNLRARGIQTGGAGLQAATTSTTVRGGKTVHDGPFAETKEQLAGFYLIDVADIDAAIAIAKQIPLHENAGAIEIRPLLGPG